LLDIASSTLFAPTVDYYRCDPCGHVWTHSKFDPNAPAVSVTETKGVTPQPEQ
jgi:hypothetical protein